MKNIIVTDQIELWHFLDGQVDIFSSSEYLTNQELFNDKNIRVINLCRNYDYQSVGYYVSLLAEARGQKIFPSVMAVQDVKAATSRAIVDATIQDDIQHALRNIKSDEFVLSVYFGKNMAKKYNALCAKFHELFSIPLFRIHFVRKREWVIQKIKLLSITDVPENHRDFFIEAAKDYIARKRFYFAKIKNYLYDMAILVNYQDKTAPSDEAAIKKFITAGDKIGINVQAVKKDEIKSLSDFNALFIRETTSIMHWTYNLSRRAQAEGMIVVDDPVSMLRCTNKVYLAELLRRNKINTPATTILHKNFQQSPMQQMEYPLVLKQPDGSSSQGVVKVDNEDELRNAANVYFKNSDLIIAQKFLPTEYDWRIGVFDNKVIFACQYYMIKDHWKIMHWENGEMDFGYAVCVDLAEVPKPVMQVALQSTALIGDGLYGVDLKQIGDQVYVIEVNDNPSIDHGYEDVLAGDQLYTDVMQIFLQRLKMRNDNVQ